MRKVLACVCLVVGLGACAPHDVIRLGGGIRVICTEDMRCWNCHTMGNRVCGKGHG